jgi:uncharacterized membrane protein
MTLTLDLLRGRPAAAEVAKPVPPAPDVMTAHPTRPRVASIDLLRGGIMILMALDHTRDFFGASGMNPRDVTEPALFLTRWVTHYCAPLFIFLAGISAFLYGTQERTTGEVSLFLLTRGVWLMALEFTLVRLGWSFDLSAHFFVAQVIWVIGASMVVLAGLVHMPRPAIVGIALVTICGHNLLDGIPAETFGARAWIWNLLHQPQLLQLGPDTKLLALYPLIPWLGVMAAGYALGPLFKADTTTRMRWLGGLGGLVTVGFVVLRVVNRYGDPGTWAEQGSPLGTALSFLNCEKYPPSLLYLMMTLGPGLLMLAAFEHAKGRLTDWVITFGRVPLFYYVAHIYLIHALAVAYAWTVWGEASWLLGAPGGKPAGYGLSLPGIYAVAIFIVLTLHPLCRWFMTMKQTRTGWWWRYF